MSIEATKNSYSNFSFYRPFIRSNKKKDQNEIFLVAEKSIRSNSSSQLKVHVSSLLDAIKVRQVDCNLKHNAWFDGCKVNIPITHTLTIFVNHPLFQTVDINKPLKPKQIQTNNRIDKKLKNYIKLLFNKKYRKLKAEYENKLRRWYEYIYHISLLQRFLHVENALISSLEFFPDKKYEELYELSVEMLTVSPTNVNLNLIKIIASVYLKKLKIRPEISREINELVCSMPLHDFKKSTFLIKFFSSVFFKHLTVKHDHKLTNIFKSAFLSENAFDQVILIKLFDSIAYNMSLMKKYAKWNEYKFISDLQDPFFDLSVNNKNWLTGFFDEIFVPLQFESLQTNWQFTYTLLEIYILINLLITTKKS